MINSYPDIFNLTKKIYESSNDEIIKLKEIFGLCNIKLAIMAYDDHCILLRVVSQIPEFFNSFRNDQHTNPRILCIRVFSNNTWDKLIWNVTYDTFFKHFTIEDQDKIKKIKNEIGENESINLNNFLDILNKNTNVKNIYDDINIVVDYLSQDIEIDINNLFCEAMNSTTKGLNINSIDYDINDDISSSIKQIFLTAETIE